MNVKHHVYVLGENTTDKRGPALLHSWAPGWRATPSSTAQKRLGNLQVNLTGLLSVPATTDTVWGHQLGHLIPSNPFRREKAFDRMYFVTVSSCPQPSCVQVSLRSPSVLLYCPFRLNWSVSGRVPYNPVDKMYIYCWSGVEAKHCRVTWSHGTRGLTTRDALLWFCSSRYP